MRYIPVKRFSLAALIMVLAVVLSAAAPQGALLDGPKTPVSVKLDVSSNGGLGGTIEAKCVVSSAVALTDVKVSIKGTLGTTPQTTNKWVVNFAENETKTFTTTFNLTKKGNKEITCRAIEVNKNAPRWGDMGSVYFRVEDAATQAGWSNVPVTTRMKLLPAEMAAQVEASDIQASGAATGDGPEELNEPIEEGPGATKCYYGRFYFYDRGTYKPPASHTTSASRNKFTLKPIPYATVWLYNASNNAYLGSSLTDDNGYFYECVTGVSSLKVKVATISNWRVVSSNGSTTTSNVFKASTGSISGSSSNIGNWFINKTSSNLLAWWTYVDLVRGTYYFFDPARGYSGYGPADPGAPSAGYTVGPFYGSKRVRVQWTSSSTHGTHYHRTGSDENEIHLYANDPRSPDALLHEQGHHLMDHMYNETFWPSGYGGCPSPHYYNGVSNRDCAWSEGWANAVALIVKDDKTYRWASGSKVNNETRSGFASGDEVEGNVAATFWDWIDKKNDGSGSNKDYVQYKIDRFLQTVNLDNSNTFAHYFADWKSYGDWCQPVKRALKHNINTSRSQYSCP